MPTGNYHLTLYLSLIPPPFTFSHPMGLGKGQEEPGCDKKCSDCGLESCVLKEIELTGGYVSIQ